MSERCLFCDRPAVGYCDEAIALVIGGVERQKGQPDRPVTTMEAMTGHNYTCSAPFCTEHGRVIGHVSGKDPDTIDQCIGCLEAGQQGRRPLMTPEEIDAERRRWHAAYRRARFHDVKEQR